MPISVGGGNGQSRCINGSSIGTTAHNVNGGISMFVYEGQNVHGGMFRTFGGSIYNVGLAGIANNNGLNRLKIGTYGYASNNMCGGNVTIGVYGEAISGAVPPCGAYPGYFVGSIVTTLPPIVISDAQLKTEVQPLESPLDKILALIPVKYKFTPEAQAELAASDELTAGFIAQNVKEVIPEAAQEIPAPQGHDEEGNLVYNPATYIGVKPDVIMPYLAGAIQELNAKITVLENMLEENGFDVKSLNNTASDQQIRV